MTKPKGAAAPLVRTAKQQAALEKQREADDLAAATTAAKDQAARLAQIVNLHIAGYSLADIGLAIGASADEVDRMLAHDTARYIKNQPALRAYVRNWISERYMKMIDADWNEATDPNHKEKLEHQDRVDRFLRQMARLHGAEAPTQAEVKVDAAPEAVEKLVAALAASQGKGYDADVFDVVPSTVVHDAVIETTRALEVSGNRIDEQEASDGDDL